MGGWGSLFTNTTHLPGPMVYANRLTSVEPALLGDKLNSLEVALASNPSIIRKSPELAETVKDLREAIVWGNPHEIEETRATLVSLLRGLNGAGKNGISHGANGTNGTVHTGSIRFRPDGVVLAEARKLFRDKQAEQKAQADYRATTIYLSNGGSLPIEPGISLTSPLPNSIPNVLFINHSPPGSNGSGTYSKAMAKHVINRGGRAAILYFGTSLDPDLEVPQYLVPFTPVKGEALPGAAKAFMPVILSNATNPNGTKIRDLSEPQMKAYTEGLADAVAVAARHMGADVIVANHAMMTGEAARRTGLPYVVVCHGSCMENVKVVQQNPQDYAPTFLDATFQGVRSANRIVALTPDARTKFAEVYGVDESDISVIPNGFDIDKFVRLPALNRADVLQGFGIDPTGISHIISYHGRMDERKGIPVILKAASMVKVQIPGVRFVLAGGGTLLEQYKQMAKDLEIDDIVYFIGHRSQSDLVLLDNISDISMLVSHDEPFGIAALEAAGTGTPVIATRVGGLKSFVTPDFGTLIEPNNPDQLALTIVDALQTDWKGKIGEHAAAYVHDQYPWPKVGDKLLSNLRGDIQHRQTRIREQRQEGLRVIEAR